MKRRKQNDLQLGITGADRFKIDNAAKIIMERHERFSGERQIAAYALLVAVRFPELIDCLDCYVAQSILRLSHQPKLRTPRARQTSSGLNSDDSNAVQSDPAGMLGPNQTLDIATKAWPPEFLDRLHNTPDALHMRGALIAEFVVKAALHDPALLSTGIAERAFALDIMKGGNIWDGRRKRVALGPGRTAFYDAKGDKTILLKFFLGLHRRAPNSDKTRLYESTDHEDIDNEYPMEEEETEEQYPTSPLTRSDKLFSDFFSRSFSETDVNFCRVGLRKYKAIVDKMAPNIPARNKWGSELRSSYLWKGLSPIATRSLAHYKFDKKQLEIIRHVLGKKAP